MTDCVTVSAEKQRASRFDRHVRPVLPTEAMPYTGPPRITKPQYVPTAGMPRAESLLCLCEGHGSFWKRPLHLVGPQKVVIDRMVDNQSVGAMLLPL